MQPQGDSIIPQSKPRNVYISLRGDNQVRNNAGGYVYKLKDIDRLMRYLIIGTSDNTYYAFKEKLTKENVQCVERLIKAKRGPEVVQKIVEVSEARRNLKQNSLLYAFAICARSNDLATKNAAYAVISRVCRIPTFLFMFIKFCEEESKESGGAGTGWGRAHKRGISRWYTDFHEDPIKLARHVTKYKNREGWTHKDALRLAHTNTQNSAIGFIFRYIVKDMDKAKEMYCSQDQLEKDPKLAEVVAFLAVADEACRTTDEKRLCTLIEEHKLVREHCPSQMLKSGQVWRSLLKNMPAEALIRNLGVMTVLGLFDEGSPDLDLVLEKIKNLNTVVDDGVRVEMDTDDDDDHVSVSGTKTNILHPFKILLALETYKHPSNKKGATVWVANQKIVDALDKAFYKAFDQVEETGQKFYLAVDVSGSMHTPVLGCSTINCSTAAAAMMMVTARSEKKHKPIIKGFCHVMQDLGVSRNDKLENVLKEMDKKPFGPTDCAAPVIDAMEEKIYDIDCFIVYTDCETWIGKIHPSEAIENYRKFSRKNTKMIVVAMTADKFTIADPDDGGMLDVSGFDSAVPRLINEFVSENKSLNISDRE